MTLATVCATGVYIFKPKFMENFFVVYNFKKKKMLKKKMMIVVLVLLMPPTAHPWPCQLQSCNPPLDYEPGRLYSTLGIIGDSNVRALSIVVVLDVFGVKREFQYGKVDSPLSLVAYLGSFSRKKKFCQ